MTKHFSLFVLALSCVYQLFSQELRGTHEVVPSGNLNGYAIQTTVSGLQGVGVARIVYLIDGVHTFVPSVANKFFVDRSENGVSFYLMEIPSSGELVLDFGVALANSGAVDFQVEFHYFENQKKKYKNFPSVYLPAGPELAIKTIAGEKLAAAEKEKPKIKYTIQLLALSKFSQDRLDHYCKIHRLNADMLTNKRAEKWVKIYYGNFETERAAISARADLVQNHNLSELIVVVLLGGR
jgi:hypothetical protein